VNTFVVDYQDHPQMIEIHAEMKRLSGPVHDVGHAPYTKGVLHAAEAEEKVFHLCHYGEKLATAFGLINTAPGTPLQIIKNLWVRLPHFHKVQFKSSWKSNHGKGCQLLSSFLGQCL
jgi:hypothetical protein